jgi:hypothetical protein
VSAALGFVSGIALDAAGNLFISDGDHNVIRKLSAATGLIISIAGQTSPAYSGDGGPALAARLNRPRRVSH